MNLDNLEKIQKVEAPPSLFARIQKRIEQNKKEIMPTFVTLSLTSAFALLLIINTIVLVNHQPKINTVESFANSIHLTSNNSLYE